MTGPDPLNGPPGRGAEQQEKKKKKKTVFEATTATEKAAGSVDNRAFRDAAAATPLWLGTGGQPKGLPEGIPRALPWAAFCKPFGLNTHSNELPALPAAAILRA